MSSAGVSVDMEFNVTSKDRMKTPEENTELRRNRTSMGDRL
jgi:hypothetical protein